MDSARPVGSGGLVRSVRPDSPAARAGVEPGDVLVAVGEHELLDVIDVQFHTAEPEFELAVARSGKRMTLGVERSYEDGDVGIEFAHPLFDGLRLCRNRCEFCFVAQLPRGVRKSLTVRDDDYRLSFLSGTFVTLTNLDEADWRRIEEQHLSPLYVSVHATDPAVRRRLLGDVSDSDVLRQLARLGRSGIEVHAQIVLVPGVNDGRVLAQTLDDLQELFPTVPSVSLVPVGLTRYCGKGQRPVSQTEARETVTLARERQAACRGQWGIGWVYPSDELLLIAGAGFPVGSQYDGYPQIQNGVGLVRSFLDDWARTRRRLRARSARSGVAATAVTGMAFARILSRCVESANALLGCRLRVLAVRNSWLGESVNVAGLLSGADVLEAAAREDLGECVFLPQSMLDSEGRMTLDDMRVEDLESRLGRRVVPAGTMSELSQFLLDGV